MDALFLLSTGCIRGLRKSDSVDTREHPGPGSAGGDRIGCRAVLLRLFRQTPTISPDVVGRMDDARSALRRRRNEQARSVGLVGNGRSGLARCFRRTFIFS